VIPAAHITEWKLSAPWVSDAQVEQDLVISRSIVELFSDPVLLKKLAFRGGTALHKLFLSPPSRYSEDIDLVQTDPSPIGEIVNLIRSALSPFLGEPARKIAERGTTLTFAFQSESTPTIRLKLKIEINTREHTPVFDFHEMHFTVESRWFSGSSIIQTYAMEELLGTKMRALYQRRKGRDLFDLWYGLTVGKANPERIATAFKQYVEQDGLRISRRDFIENLQKKLSQDMFTGDTKGLLRQDIAYQPEDAFRVIMETIIAHL
jgi:predicted nucleotidyltransferase component of viral defense system